MKKIIIPFFCAALFTTTVSAQTKTAITAPVVKSQVSPQLVIDSYLNALGGKSKLEAVKTTITENTMSLQGMEIAMNTKKMGNKFKSVQSVMGQEVTQMFDGEKGYINQMGNKSDFPATAIPELKKGKIVIKLSFFSLFQTSIVVFRIFDIQ